MQKKLDHSFFARPTLVVARDLIGKYLVRQLGDRKIALMITETEGYFGFEDKGSHAHRGQTPRNTPMFAEAGTIYVYFTYGMHWMLNLVCEEKGFPAAVLVRGLEDHEHHHLNGPAKLTKYLRIDRALNGKRLGKEAGLWVEDRGVQIPPKAIKRTPRIGIPNRGEWTEKPWRFAMKEKLTASKTSSPRRNHLT